MEEHRQNPLLPVEEMIVALSQTNLRKASGNNKVAVDIFKAATQSVMRWLHDLYKRVQRNEQIPKGVECDHIHRTMQEERRQETLIIVEALNY